MVFSNGLNWSTSTGDWNREMSASDGSSNFAYGSEKLVPAAESILKYYFNDSLIYTSELTVADLYPYTRSYEEERSVTINADYVSSTNLDFTMTDWHYPPLSGTGVGLNSVNTLTNWDALTAQFAFDATGGQTIFQYKVREGGVDKTSYVPFTPANGDKFSLRWSSDTPGSTTLLPPPPLIARF